MIMWLLLIAILSEFSLMKCGATDSVVFPVPNTLSDDRTNLELQLRQSSTRNTSTAERIQRFPSRLEVDFVPYVSSLPYYDEQVVALLRNYTHDDENAAKLSPEHKQLIYRYITEWDEIIVKTAEKEADEFFLRDSTMPFMIIPGETHNIYKLLRMIVRVYEELPVILSFCNSPPWIGQVISQAMREALSSKIYLEHSHLQSLAHGMLILGKLHDLSPSEIYPEEIIQKIPEKDFIHVGFSEVDANSLRETLKWLTFAKKRILKSSSRTRSSLDHRSAKAESGMTKERTNNGDSGSLAENSESRFAIHYINIVTNITSLQHDHLLENQGFDEKTNKLFPVPLSKVSIERQLTNYEEEDEEYRNLRKQYRTPEFHVPASLPISRNLCKGIDERPPSESAHLDCRYDRLNSAWLHLMPAKVEVILEDPQILFFHHVLTHTKIEKLQHLALTLQEPSTLAGKNGLAAPTTEKRFSYLAYMSTNITKEVRETNLISGYLTGLNVVPPQSSEDLQVTVYTSGGHYQEHMDTIGHNLVQDHLNESEAWKLRQQLHPNGDRLATLMYYMNDVESGGRTVFPILGVSVQPEKGAAVLWHSVHDSGEIDFRTYHAGCPIRSGLKWVANKWVYYNAQLFKRPCKRTKKEDT